LLAPDIATINFSTVPSAATRRPSFPS
jgi:hypothetical protein